MPWFNVDDGFANSKPVLKIPRRYRCAAIGLWTLAGSWSAKELTNGFIPDHALEEFAGTTALAGWLVCAGLWRRVEEGWQFENWAKWQKTKEQVLAYREREAEKKRQQRSKPKGAGSGCVSPGDSLGTESGVPEGHNGESPPCPAPPLPTPLPEPKPKLSLVTSGGDLSLVGTPEPPDRCTKHSNDISPPRCPSCGDARRFKDEWKRQHKEVEQLEREAHWAAIAACGLCDHNGMREVGNDQFAKCNHQEAS